MLYSQRIGDPGEVRQMSTGTQNATNPVMTKETIKFTSKNRRKAEYTIEGMAQLEEFQRENRGQLSLSPNNVILGGRKRGHGRGKASDAGPSKKRKAA
jgi:hypothetical protein